jgi:ABC-2 type transport system permease protein
VVGLLTGLAIHLPGWSAGTVAHMLGVFLGSALLTLVLCTVVAWIACISRGYLPAVGFAILTLILTNFVAIALPNILPYFPWGIPALYSGIAGREPLPQPGMASYLVLAATGILGFAGTVLWWRFADQT